MQIGIFVSLNTKILFKMKKIILSFLTIGALIVSSCSSDPCKDKTAATTCSGRGTPTANGSSCGCTCDAGYYSANCSVSSNGTYSASADALNGNPKSAYSAVVTIQGNVVSIVGGFPYLWSGTTQTLTGTYANNVITISNVDPTGTGAQFSGTGTISYNTDNKMQIVWSNAKFVQVSSGSSLAVTSTWLK